MTRSQESGVGSQKVSVALIAVALFLGLAPTPAGWVERFYSNRFYPLVQSLFTSISNRIPFALGDLLALSLVACAGYASFRTRGRPRSLAHLAFGAAALGAAVYAAFLVLWGLNYRREPLTRKLAFDAGRVTARAAEEMLHRTISALNAESVSAHSRPWPGDTAVRAGLRASFDAAAAEAGNAARTVPGVAKRSIIDGYLGAAGLDGFTNPFGLEIILNSELLPFERPFVMAHEWGHLAGFADESEAGFIGLVTCIRSADPALRYSGWLALYELLPRSHREALPALAPQVAADLRAIDARLRRRYQPALAQAQERVYDRFLKANRVEEGIASYGLAVRLVLGTRMIG